MEIAIRIETVDARPLAVVRRRATLQQLSKVIPDACGLVWGVVRGQKITGAGRLVALYLDNVMNVEIGVELEAPYVSRAESPEVISSTLPAGRVATAVHFGPYNQLTQVHEAVRDWCAAHGHTLAGPGWEIYGHWIDEWNTNPSLIRTDIYYLLADEKSAA